MDTSQKSNEVVFNVGLSDALQLAGLKGAASRAAQVGNFYKVFTINKEIRINYLNYQIKDPIKTQLDKFEKNTDLGLIAYTKYKEQYEKISHSLMKKELAKQILIKMKRSKRFYMDNLKEYRNIILTQLKELGYMPNKDDRTKMSF